MRMLNQALEPKLVAELRFGLGFGFLQLLIVTVDSPHKILFGAQDFGSILYHLYGEVDGYLIRSELCT